MKELKHADMLLSVKFTSLENLCEHSTRMPGYQDCGQKELIACIINHYYGNIGGIKHW